MASRGSMIKMDSKYLLKSSFLSALSIFLSLISLSVVLAWLHLTTSMWFQALASRGALPAPALVSPRSYREAQGSCAVVVVQWSAEDGRFWGSFHRRPLPTKPCVPMPVEQWRFSWDQRPRHFWSDRMWFRTGFVYNFFLKKSSIALWP